MTKDRSAVKLAREAMVFEDDLYSYSSKGPHKKSRRQNGALVGIIETLYSEHGYIRSLLDTLEQQSSRLEPRKIPDYHLLLEIVDYLTRYPGQFHHPREDLLFAGLLKRDKKFQTQLDRLQREHRMLQFYNDKLFNELSRIVNGRRADRPRLLSAITRFIAGYQQHIEFESQQIFPLAKGTLTAGQLKSIEAKTRTIDDPLFGAEVQRQYGRLARKLRARIGNASEELMIRELSAIAQAIENLSGLVDTLAELKTAINTFGKTSLQEQLDTVKAHVGWNHGPSIVSLPVALLKNHRVHLAEAMDEIKKTLSREVRDSVVGKG